MTCILYTQKITTTFHSNIRVIWDQMLEMDIKSLKIGCCVHIETVNSSIHAHIISIIQMLLHKLFHCMGSIVFLMLAIYHQSFTIFKIKMNCSRLLSWERKIDFFVDSHHCCWTFLSLLCNLIRFVLNWFIGSKQIYGTFV